MIRMAHWLCVSTAAKPREPTPHFLSPASRELMGMGIEPGTKASSSASPVSMVLVQGAEALGVAGQPVEKKPAVKLSAEAERVVASFPDWDYMCCELPAMPHQEA